MVCFPGETIALVQTDSDAEQYIERDPARTMVNSEMTTSVDGGEKRGRSGKRRNVFRRCVNKMKKCFTA